MPQQDLAMSLCCQLASFFKKSFLTLRLSVSYIIIEKRKYLNKGKSGPLTPLPKDNVW